jgi:diguanylate cyclase (GGDEF)-like protein
VVLLESLQQPEHALPTADKLRGALDQPLTIDGHSLRILPSIGIALYPEHGDTAQALLRHADDAMYQVKKGGDQRLLPQDSAWPDAGGREQQPA